MALKIMMFSDFVCPFCYIGLEVMRKLKPEFDFELQWRGFQIHPEWPAEGMPASEFHRGMDPDTRRAMWVRIQGMAAEAGLEMKPPAVLYNSRLALEAAEFAAEHGRAEAFEEQVYRAYFQEGANIGDREVLTELAAEAGINRDQLDEAWSSGKYTLKLKNNALMAHHRGVSGVPTFFIGEFPLVGAQSEDVVRQVLRRARERLEATE
jgi:predicted DsbA family dithiol-disulfide isomerase